MRQMAGSIAMLCFMTTQCATPTWSDSSADVRRAFSEIKRKCYPSEKFGNGEDDGGSLACCLSGECRNGYGAKVISWNGSVYREDGSFISGYLQDGVSCYANNRGECYEYTEKVECIGNCYDGFGVQVVYSAINGRTDTYEWKKRIVYEGIWRNGERLKGKATYGTGEIYDGEWLNGNQNGVGFVIGRNGDKYEGNFMDGTLNGNGTLTTRNGVTYRGLFEDGIIVGGSQEEAPKIPR